jgi:hypothetical protein
MPEFPGRIRVREGRDGRNPSRVHQVSADGGERGHEREISPGRVARYHDLVTVVAAVPQPAKSAQSVFDRIGYRVRRQLAVPHGKNTGVGRLRRTDHQGTVRIEAAGEERPTAEIEDRPLRRHAARANPFGRTVLQPYRFDLRRGPGMWQRPCKARPCIRGASADSVEWPTRTAFFTITRLASDTANDCALWR